jgi:fructoselysine-6-P-deglycase FrlB-like protein
MNTLTLSYKLDELPATVDLVARFDPAPIATAFTRGNGLHALVIGSGGSAVAAEYFARCRDSLGLGPTSIATPMHAVADHHSLNATQVWLFSAGGDNPDVSAAAQAAVDRGCVELNLVTRNPDGAAAAITTRFGGTVHVVPVADVKDGYLATHSLLAITVGLLLASATVSREPVPSPSPLEQIAARLNASRGVNERRRLVEQWTGLRTTDTVIIAADPLLRPVASLLDTSLWEASLCPVQTTDFRNLAHGRHAWFHHRRDETVLLALTGSTSRTAWSAIDEVLPNRVRRTKTDYGSCGRLENLLGLIDGLAVVEAIGEVLGIDPGKPGIGEFGRAIYDDRSLEKLANGLPARVRHKRAAIAKADAPHPEKPSIASIGRERLRTLEKADVGGAVFDYDGTIVTTEGRFEVPNQPVVDELIRLHRAGVKLGIATGRGGSAGEDLRKVLPVDILPSIVIGYYNGGYLRTADVNIDLDPPAANPAIAATALWLDGRNELFLKKKFKAGPVQIGVDMRCLRHPYRFALDLAACPQVASAEVWISASGHSFDIIPSTSSKTTVVEAVRESARPGTAILCFGDSGASSGNDHALLSHPHGISVGEVCSAPNGCWSLFGGTITGPEALLRVLSALVPSRSGEIRLNTASLPLDSR